MTEWCIAFTSGLVSTFLGLIIGIPVALFINRLIQKGENEKEKIHILQIVITCIDKNIKLIEQLSREIPNKTMPFYSVDFVILDSIARDYHVFLESNLSSKIDECRYELIHISRKIDKLFSLYDQILNEEQSKRSFEIFRQSTLLHAETLLPLLKKTKSELEATIPREIKKET